MLKKVLFISNNLNQWGQKKIVQILCKKFDTYVLLGEYQESAQNNVKVINYSEKKNNTRIETILRLFIKPPQTSNYYFGKRRNYLSKKMNFKKKLFFLIEFYFPKLLSEHRAAKILGSLKGIFDEILNEINPDIVLNLAFFTQQYPAARAKKLGYIVYDLIYSWDNPYKDSFLPNIYDKYLVWNEEMKNDLNRLHKIELNKQTTINPVQFDYLENLPEECINFTSNTTYKFINENKREYYLYVFSVGLSAMFQEIELVEHIADILYKVNPDAKIFARPYPNCFNDMKYYYALEERPNIYVQKDVPPGMIQNNDTIVLKKLLLKYAKAVINLGTTMGLEASFFSTPIIQIRYLPSSIKYSDNKLERYADLDYQMKNDHLKKYLYKEEYINVVKNEMELQNIFIDLTNDNFNKYTSYTRYLKKIANPFPGKSSSDLLIEAIEGHR